jgi:hypothetical protein
MDLKKLERYLRVNLLGPGPSSYTKRIYRSAVAQRLRNTALSDVFYRLPIINNLFVFAVCERKEAVHVGSQDFK